MVWHTAVPVRFRGEHVQRTDAKYRLSIPAGFRRILSERGDQRLVLVRSLTGPCITVYPASTWEAREDRIAKLPQSDPTVVHLLRIQVASAAEVVPDGHGRARLTQVLRDHAGIKASSEVVVVGQIRHFEIWNLESWQKASAESAAELLEWRGDLARLDL